MKTKHLVFFGAMSSILLIGTANADTHVSTKGYADRHVAGAEGAVATSANDKQLIQIRNVGTDTEPIMKYVFANMPSAGSGITIDENNEISVTDRYKAGTNVTFGTADGNGIKPINAVDTTSVAGDNSVNIVAGTGANAGKQVVTVKHDGTLTVTDSGLHVNVTDTDTQYTSGAGTTVTDNGPINVNVDNSTISIGEDNKLKANYKTYRGGDFVSVSDEGEITTTYSAGDNVTIDADGKINATDTTYGAGEAITVDNDNKINVKHDETLSVTTGGELHVNVTDTNTTYNSGVATTIDGSNNVNVDVDGTTIVTTGDRLSVPIATTGAVGVVKVGDNLSIDANGKLDATDTKYYAGDRVTLDTTSNKFSANLATATTAGAVLPDGSTINLNASDGKISVPTATPSSYGIVKYDNDTITTNEAGQLKAKQAQYVSHVDTSGNHLDKTGTSISAGIDGIIPAPTNYYSFYAGSGDWVEPTTIINWTLPNKCRIPNIRCSLTSYAGNDGKAYMRWEPLTNTYYNDDGTDTMPTNVNDDSSFPAPPAVR